MYLLRIRESAGARRFSFYFAGLLLTALGFFAFSGCDRRGDALPSVVLTSKISPEPPRVGPVAVHLSLADSSSRPVHDAKMTLEADMSHPGMAPVFADARETSSGNYEGTVNLNMPGDWVVLVHGNLADGKKLERQIDVKGVQAK